jgi:hypothetical protein
MRFAAVAKFALLIVERIVVADILNSPNRFREKNKLAIAYYSFKGVCVAEV